PALAALSLSALIATSVGAQELCPPTATDGVNTLFIGHSFFIPVAREFDELAVNNSYTNHQFDYYFSGGASGDPAALWNNPVAFRAIDEKLAARDVDLLGLTIGVPGTSIDAYINWIELALDYNPNTNFFIGQPWAPDGPQVGLADYEVISDVLSQSMLARVHELRRRYPETRIDYISYGETAVEMRKRLDAGELPDIDCVYGCDGAWLYTDTSPGHTHPMVHELSALSWMRFIYGAEIESLDFTDYESDVLGIMDQVELYNLPFQAPPHDANADGQLNFFDVAQFLSAYNAGNQNADFYVDGQLNFFDVSAFLDAYNIGCLY
ncbi:MAG: GC-type dockerin domain-anchored protein, partial [Planctomycetota bacterium]